MENWVRYHSGQAVKVLINPAHPPAYQTSYESEHTHSVTSRSPLHRAGGRPTRWHQYDILTGNVNTSFIHQNPNQADCLCQPYTSAASHRSESFHDTEGDHKGPSFSWQCCKCQYKLLKCRSGRSSVNMITIIPLVRCLY